MREALFNVLTARRNLAGLSVLDLYAGSGALGLEALSRGAASALFVESDRRGAAVIARNIATLGLSGAAVHRGSVTTVVSSNAQAPVDLVFADPPYGIDAAEIESVLAALITHGWARAGTVAVVERPTGSAPLSWPAGWRGWQPRRYGDTRLELAELEP